MYMFAYLVYICTRVFFLTEGLFLFPSRRSLKRTRSVLPSSSRVARKRRHTMQVFPPMEQCKDSQYHDDRQADCASVVSCSQANAPGNDDGTVVQRLDFDGAGHDQQQLDEIGSLANRLDHTPPTRRRRVIYHDCNSICGSLLHTFHC